MFAAPPSLDPGSRPCTTHPCPSGFHSPGSTKSHLNLNTILGRFIFSESLTAAMAGHVIGETSVIGTYEKE